MKTKTYPCLAVMLSLIMIFAASCGRQREQAIASASDEMTKTGETALAVETPYISDVLIISGRVCRRDSGLFGIMEPDGNVIVFPYDRDTLCLPLADSGSVTIEPFEIGTKMRIYYRAGEDGAYGEIVKMEAEDEYAPVFLHGIVCRTGETLLVHPEPWRVLDTAKVDPAECYEIPMTGVPLVWRMTHEWIEDINTVQVGDYVMVYHSETMDTASRPSEVYRVIACGNVNKQMTATVLSEKRILLNGIQLSRSIFDNGKVLDMTGNVISFEDVSTGDLFEVQHGGEILTSSPGQFGHLHSVRRIKTAAQIKAEQAAQAALEALTKVRVERGTVRVLANGNKRVWLGETSAPEEIGYFSCVIVGGRNMTITDAATGQMLTWDDLQDGDYVAIEGSGAIASTAPAQWDNVKRITRLSRVTIPCTVSAVGEGEVTLLTADGTARTVSADAYYLRGERLEIDSLAVGDTVRLDVNALDENEVYALHLIDREVQIPEDAVRETFRVNIVSGTRVYMVRDLSYDTTQIPFDEDGAVIYDGDVSFDRKQIFYDSDGSVRSAKQIRQGDLIIVVYSGADFETVYQIIRKAE